MNPLIDSIEAVSAAVRSAVAALELPSPADSNARDLLAAIEAVSTAYSAMPDEVVPVQPALTDQTRDLVGSVSCVAREVLSEWEGPEVDDSEGEGAIFPLLGRDWDENLHSDYVAALLDPSAVGFGARAFLNELFSFAGAKPDVEHAPNREFQVSEREVRLDAIDRSVDACIGSRRIDILVRTGTRVLVVESKTGTSESTNQTRDYAETVLAYYAQHPVPKRREQIAFLLLSPHGEPGQDRRFRGISFVDLYGILKRVQAASDGKPAGRRLLEAYLTELAAVFVLPRSRSISYSRSALEKGEA